MWIDECRARKVRREAAEKPELSDGQVINGEHHTTQQIEWSRVDAAMAELPQDQRQIISLVAIQGLPYKVVADILEVENERAIRIRLSVDDPPAETPGAPTAPPQDANPDKSQPNHSS